MRDGRRTVRQRPLNQSVKVVKCKAKKYLDKSNSQTTDCTNDAEYGCLCWRHARLVASTPNGFHMNRIKRVHFENCTDVELRASAIQYSVKKGIPTPQRPNNPHSYRRQVLRFIEENESVTAGQIVAHIRELTNSTSMTAQKIGQLMSALKKEGMVVRRVVTLRQDGRKFGSAIYTLA